MKTSSISILNVGFLLILAFSGCGIAATAIANRPPKGYAEHPKQKYREPLTFSKDAAVFHAGFAKRKITPEDIEYLAGFLPSRHGLFVHDDLWSKCLVLKDRSGKSLAIASLDLLGLLPSDVKEIQERASSFFDGKILIHATHTHSAPDTKGLWGFGIIRIPILSGRNEEYMRFLKKQVTSCLREAAQNAQPAVVGFAAKELRGLARSRSGISPDETLALIYVRSEKDSVILVNYALHPDLIYSSYVTADFLYYTYGFLEKETGSEIMYINGAIGGMQAIKFGPFRKRWHQAKKIGEALGRKVLNLLTDVTPSKKDIISWQTKIIPVKVENKNFIRATRFGLIPDQRDSTGRIPVEVNYVVIGDAEIITFPGEAFPNIALRVKDYLKGPYQFTFGLTNASLGYFLLSPDYKSGRYRYHVSMSLGPNVGDEIRDALRELILQNE